MRSGANSDELGDGGKMSSGALADTGLRRNGNSQMNNEEDKM